MPLVRIQVVDLTVRSSSEKQPPKDQPAKCMGMISRKPLNPPHGYRILQDKQFLEKRVS